MRRVGIVGGWLLALLLGMGALLTPSIARAQTTTDSGSAEEARDWNVRLGIFSFANTRARDASGSDVGISGLVERAVYRGDTYDVNVGIGYNGFDRVYSVPLMGYVIYHPRSYRVGAGLGYSFNKRINGDGSNGIAFALLAGYEFVHGRNPVSGDLRYYFIGGSSSELDGLSLTLGVKF